MAIGSSRKLLASFARWIRPLSGGWKPLQWVWLAVIVGILVNTASSWLATGTLDEPGSPLDWFLTHLGITIPLVCGFGVMTILSGLAHQQFTSQKTTSATLQPERVISVQNERTARQKLLKQVRAIWIDGLLEHSLHHVAWIDLHLEEQADAVEDPWKFVLQERDQPPHSLPTGTHIAQVYDQADGQLLILGEPGAGKTTLLLQLARTLLARATSDEQYPLPVIFLLSTWAVAWEQQKRKLSFDRWLIDELTSFRYGVPRPIAEGWIKARQIILLLDGLDEVAPEARLACVGALRAYQRDADSQIATGLALCCRHQEYEDLAVQLPLHIAVTILPLSDEQVHNYLARASGQLDGLRNLMHLDKELAQLVHWPLMLNIATLAFQGKHIVNFPSTTNFPSPDNFPMHTSQKQLFEIVFTAYVTKMLFRRKALPTWMQQSFLSWLCFIARQLQRHQQTKFSIGDLQNWLPETQLRLYRWSITLCFVLAYGLVSWLIGISFGEQIFGSVGELAFGLVGGLTSVLIFSWLRWLFPVYASAPMPQPTLRSVLRNIPVLLGIGLFLGLFVGLIFGLIGTLVGWLIGKAIGGLIFGVTLGLVSSLYCVAVFGSSRFISHLLCRFLLWRGHLLPWRLGRVLDEAAARLLLRKVGNEYIFVHRLLLDFFATLDELMILQDLNAKRTTEQPPSGV